MKPLKSITNLSKKHAARGAVLLSVALLSACAAPSWSAKLTRYQQWPHDAVGARYQFKATEQEKNNLEFQAFADMVRAAIGPTGLVYAEPGTEARFVVEMEYGNPVEQRWVQQYRDSVYGPWGWGGIGINDGWAGGMFYSPPVLVNVPVQAYKNNLTIVIKDKRSDGREVYRAQAVSYSQADNLAAQMPYLAQAVFDTFPGNNGQVLDVNYKKAALN